MAPHGTGTPLTGAAQQDISFSSYVAETPDLEDVYRLAPATGAVTPVSQQPSPEQASHRGGDWSPDRTRLVGFGGPGPRTRTFVWDAATGAVHAEAFCGEDSPTWLDDHTLLVLQRVVVYLPGDASRTTDEVFALDTSTWTLRQVTQVGGSLAISSLRWHPRAGMAMAVGPVGASGPMVGVRVATCSAARVLRAVSGTSGRVLPRDLREPFGATPTSFPDWSPDGTRLAVVRRHADVPGWSAVDIAVGNVRSGRLTTLVDGTHLDDAGDPARPSGYGMPAWSPDGREVAYVEYYRDSWGEIWVVDASGARRRQVTSLGHTQVVVSLDW